jgi:peptide/nickel transport system permease protein
MGSYIIRRVLLMIPCIIIVSIVVFFTIRLIPGSILDIMVAQQQTAGENAMTREQLGAMMGLDVPIYVQYGRWVGNIILHGDFGYSLWKSYPILPLLLQRFPVSLELGTIALFVAMIIALPIGIYAAIRQDTWGDYIARSFSIACIAIPGFWIGTMVIVYPSVWWNWSPPMQYMPFLTNPIENLKIIVIPAVIMGMSMSGITMRMTRAMMLEVLRQDYIRTAWAKGATERVVILKHAMKNAFIPVVSIIGLQIPTFIGGSVVMEQIFSLPGIGRLTVEVLNSRDYPVLSGINIFMVGIVLLTNLFVDLTYAYLDPRIRYN